MKRDHQIAHEARRTQRVRLPGTVQVGDGMCWARGRIVDVSAGGLRVLADRGWQTGAQVYLDLCFDVAPTEHFALTGHVRRSIGATFAIELDCAHPAVAAFVRQELLAMAFRARGWTVQGPRVPAVDMHRIAIGKPSGERDPAGSWVSSGDAQRDLDVAVGRQVPSHGARARPLTARPRHLRRY